MRSRRIRILHVMESAEVGGIATFVLDLARHIDRRAFDLKVCVLRGAGPIADALRDEGVDVAVLGAKGDSWRRSLAGFFVRQGWRGYDILHSNFGGRVPRYLARLFAYRQVVSHVHGPPDEWVYDLRAGTRRLSGTIAQAHSDGADRIVACSQALRRMLVSSCPELGARTDVLHYGVDLSRFDPERAGAESLKKELDWPEGARVVGFVGRIVPQKGLAHLIAASKILLSENPAIHVAIVGDGPLRGELEGAAARLPRNRIRWLGQRPDIPRLMSLFDVLAVPSEWEPLGIVALEAMAAAKPVVAFDVDGLSEVVVHEATGLLVHYRDAGALASALGRLLENETLSRRMGLAGRRRVEAHFDSRAVARAFESLYAAAFTEGSR